MTISSLRVPRGPDPEFLRIKKWVKAAKKEKSYEGLIQVLMGVPQANISIKPLLGSRLKEELVDPFKWLCLREMKQILEWMKSQLNPRDYESSYNAIAAGQIRRYTSPKKFLFEVIKVALEKKALLKEFSKMSDFKEIEETFSYLLYRGLVNR